MDGILSIILSFNNNNNIPLFQGSSSSYKHNYEIKTSQTKLQTIKSNITSLKCNLHFGCISSAQGANWIYAVFYLCVTPLVKTYETILMFTYYKLCITHPCVFFNEAYRTHKYFFILWKILKNKNIYINKRRSMINLQNCSTYKWLYTEINLFSNQELRYSWNIRVVSSIYWIRTSKKQNLVYLEWI